MNIIISQSKLQTALRFAERVISKNISLPILSTVLLKAKDGQLKLSATNLEMGLNYWLGAKIDQAGEIAVPARIFSEFISQVGDERLNLSVEKNIMHINSDRYKTQILGMEPKEFPLLPKIKSASQFKISAADLKDGLLGVLDATAPTETRPELNGVFMALDKNKAAFAATDSFRLAEKIITLQATAEIKIIIPRNTAAELVRIAGENGPELTVNVADNQLFVVGESFEFISRLIDGRYPDYKKIIPEKFISLVKVNKAGLERNIRTAGIFSSSISDIKIKVEDNLMMITAKNSDRGEIDATVDCQLKNEPFELSLNYRYLLDGLKTISTENAIIQFTGDGSPLVLKGDERQDQTYLIMPLRN
ncbi:MAG: DNA polymerase III subunit beta [Patescibacteria group bacterium]